MNRYTTALRCVAAASGGAGTSSPASPRTLIIKPLNAAGQSGESEPPTQVVLPAPQGDSDAYGGAAAESADPTRPRRPRSPFAVLCGQSTAPGLCASALRPKAPFPTAATASQTTSTPHPAFSSSWQTAPELCACTALIYDCDAHEANAGGPRSSTPTADEVALHAVRDRFLLALKLSPASEARLRACVTETEMASLLASMCIPHHATSASTDETRQTWTCTSAVRLTNLCHELPAAHTTCARLLLPSDEGHRMRWLAEESTSLVDSFHRAASLRSLAVMVSIQRATARRAHRGQEATATMSSTKHSAFPSPSSTASATPNGGRGGSEDRNDSTRGASGSAHSSSVYGSRQSSSVASFSPLSSAASSRGVPLLSPTLDTVLQVEKRMEGRGEQWTMVDLAALAHVTGDDPDVAAHLLRRCTEMLMPATAKATITSANGGTNTNGSERSAPSPGASHRRPQSAAQLERDLGQIIAALVLWQQTMHFLDATMAPTTASGQEDTHVPSDRSVPPKDPVYDAANSRNGTSHTRHSDAPTATRMASPSALLREHLGLTSHFPIAGLLDASSNLMRLHRAYLRSTVTQTGGTHGRHRRGGGGGSSGDEHAAQSLWRSASETARGLFKAGADDANNTAGTADAQWRGRSGASPTGATTSFGIPSESGDVERSLLLPQDATLRSVLFRVLDRLYKDVHRLAEETSGIIDNDEYLSAVTGWLLMQAPDSYVCARHFRRLVESDPSSALKALERSGLLGRQSPHAPLNLHVIVSKLLPLLHHCENEDFYNSAIREVLNVMEDQLRHDATAFTSEDMKELAVMGTQIFAVSPSEANHSSSFDASARGQMEELHVMDGSPWALVVSSYTALKEMVGGLRKDHQKLKQQVQEQMRNMGLMSTANTDTPLPNTNASLAHATTSADGAAAATSDAHGNERTPPSASSAARMGPVPLKLIASPSLRHRFLVFLEDLVKNLVDDNRGVDAERPFVISSELFNFINRQVPVPNIQDEYRRKIFLLVNVAEDPATTRKRELARLQEEAREAEEARRKRRHSPLLARLMDRQEAKRKSNSAAKKGSKEGDDAHGGVDEIPAELRFLVSSLPLTLSPWASVMILREVLAESAGKNPRYSYVLKAAIDLQLPISTTRSRIATTLNMWRFLNSQSHKLSLKENVFVKQRCVWNLPLSYILSSYWSLLTSFIVAFLVTLNVVGIDFESQLVANTLFQQFTPFEELDCSEVEDWHKEAATDLASDYLEQGELARKKREQRSSTNVILSTASYLFLGYDDQRRPFTLIPISSNSAGANALEAADARHAEEYAGAISVVRELSLHVPFPFFMDFEKALPLELLEARVAERIRRVSFDMTWFVPRMIIRTFPLGRQYTERSLIAHTCAQANLTRRRITFLFYIEDGVPVTETYLKRLMQSQLAQSANLVLVVHERSLRTGGVSVRDMERLMDLPPLPPPPSPQSASGGSAETTSHLPDTAPRSSSLLSRLSCLTQRTGKRESEDTPTDAAPLPAGTAQARVLPYSRQLYEQGVWATTMASSTALRSLRGAGATSGDAGRRGSATEGERGKGAAKSRGVPGDNALSPFARRFKKSRRSLRTVAEPDKSAGWASFSASSVGHGLVGTVWNGLVSPTVHIALLPVTMVVRTLGGPNGSYRDSSIDGSVDGEVRPDRDPTAAPGDGFDMPRPPAQGLVSVPVEIFKSTVQGTKHLVNSTKHGLWSAVPQRSTQAGAGLEPSEQAKADGEHTEPRHWYSLWRRSRATPAPQASDVDHVMTAAQLWPFGPSHTTAPPSADTVEASPSALFEAYEVHSPKTEKSPLEKDEKACTGERADTHAPSLVSRVGHALTSQTKTVWRVIATPFRHSHSGD